MAVQIQLRRGTAAENAAFTGAAGELVCLTDTNQLALHDNVTSGGKIFNSVDVEEGSWTPALADDTGMTVSDESGDYLKTGDIVYAYFSLKVYQSGSANNYRFEINGLPFKAVAGVRCLFHIELFEPQPWLPPVLNVEVDDYEIRFYRPRGDTVIYQGGGSSTYNNEGANLLYSDISNTTNPNLQNLKMSVLYRTS
ncbi:MAG: hypothetical protein MI685_01205 [Chlorobiales bacterium]|nr:hypothetical protein [Chlorobiales bacterium]